MDISAVVLCKLLKEQNLDAWSKIKLSFLDPAYSTLYSAIARHYNKYNTIPTFEELEATLRDGPTANTLASVKLSDVEEVSLEVALDALLDQFTQNETVRLLDRFLDKLPVYDSVEIKENLASLVITLDDKTLTTEGVYTMGDLLIFKPEEDIARERIPLGLNNTCDAVLGGCARQEYILIGGPRGSGKSITANNIMVNQYEAGNTSIYFTIEMTAYETLQRTISILANVNHQSLKQNKLSDEELLTVVKARAGMYQDSDDLVLEFMKHRDKYRFEEELVRSRKLKEDNQMIIIDDRALTLTNLDLHIGKLKARFGNKLTTVVVDYVNQIKLDINSDKYDWKPQIEVSTKLKELARKYDVLMVSPYQVDATGEARFAKGILDSCDIAFLMKAHDKDSGAISFETTKIRGGQEMVFTSGINWETLRISPQSKEMPAEEEAIPKAGRKKKTKQEPINDDDSDVPWTQ
jgi:replicative DNA helicase